MRSKNSYRDLATAEITGKMNFITNFNPICTVMEA